jgi:hypothetical protein
VDARYLRRRAAETLGRDHVRLASRSRIWRHGRHTRPGARPADLSETDGLPDGFQSFLVALRDQVIAFKKPVAYVHGDSHYLRIDKPFLNAAGQRLENFTRVQTFGDNQANGTNDVNWLKVFVDPHNREVFA